MNSKAKLAWELQDVEICLSLCFFVWMFLVCYSEEMISLVSVIKYDFFFCDASIIHKAFNQWCLVVFVAIN